MTALFRPWIEDKKVEDREKQFQNVKEHFRKRMENKKLKRSLKDETVYPTCSPTAEQEFLHLPWDEFQIVDSTLLQSLPPGILEEYARMLTEQQKQTAEKNRKQRPKKFRCPHCHVGFSNNGQLKGHIRIHTGERPFKCDAEHCGKSFTRNEELTRHRRIHSGLRPFPCPECGKPFGRKDHLKKHIRTHFQQRYQLIPIYPSHYSYFYGIP